MVPRYFPSSVSSSPPQRSLSRSTHNNISPPSLVYSDASSEDYEVRRPSRLYAVFTLDNTDQASTQDMMAIGSDPLHVSDVMADALGHLNRVVEHVGKGSPRAAGCWTNH